MKREKMLNRKSVRQEQTNYVYRIFAIKFYLNFQFLEIFHFSGIETPPSG